MSGLDNLTAKILEDAKARASEITGSAEAQARSIVSAAEAEAGRERDRILVEAEDEARRAAEQVTLSKTLAIRDQNLDAKQQMLDKVFAEALEKLNAMARPDYEKFLYSYLEALDPDGEEIILPARYSLSVDDINAHLKEKGKRGNLVGNPEGRAINGGFILCKNGIEQNNTFEALVGFYRYELEGEVLKLLY